MVVFIDLSLTKLDSWVNHGTSCAAALLDVCTGSTDSRADTHPSSLQFLSTVLLLSIHGLCVEVALRQPPQWLVTIGQVLARLADVASCLREVYSTASCSPSLLLFFNSAVGLFSRVFVSLYCLLSQNASCVVILEDRSPLPDLVSLALAMLQYYGKDPSVGIFLRAVDICHSLVLLASGEIPLSLSIPLLHQFVAADGPALLLCLVQSDASFLSCDGNCGPVPSHSAVSGLFSTLLGVISRFHLRLLGFPASNVQQSTAVVSQALSLSAADSTSCLSARLSMCLLRCISTSSCPTLLGSIVPSLNRLVPCVCIVPDDWVRFFLAVYVNCGGYQGRGRQVLHWLLDHLSQPVVVHSMLHLTESPGLADASSIDDDDAHCVWLCSLSPYLDTLLGACPYLSLPLMQHLGNLSACARWLHSKLLWEVAVPLLKNLSTEDSDDSERLPLLQSCLLLLAHVMGAFTDQTKFLSELPWQKLLDRWLSDPRMCQYAVPVCEMILQASIDQLQSSSQDDDYTAQLSGTSQPHLAFLTWLLSTIFWNPTRFNSNGATTECHRLHWDVPLLRCASSLSILLSHWVHSLLIKQMLSVIGGSEQLVVILAATLESALALLNQTTSDGKDTPPQHHDVLPSLIHRSIATIQLLSAVVFQYGDADQVSIMDELSSLCPLCFEFLSSTGNSLGNFLM